MKRLAIPLPVGTATLSSLILTVEIIHKANEYFVQKGQAPVFSIVLVAGDDEQPQYNNNILIKPHATFSTVQDVDMVIVPALGNDIDRALKQNDYLVDWVFQQYKLGVAIASLCTGAFILAAAGLLNGKQCSTHWSFAEAFKKRFPQVKLAIEKVITDEQGTYTTGGALSSVNLVLYLVEKYYDRETAIYCAKVFEVDMDRTSQSAFIIFTGQKNHEDNDIKQAQLFIENHVGDKITMEDLSSRFSIDRRNFDRRFKRATGNTPLEYMQRVKIEAAKKYLETSRKNVNEIMYEVGYSDVRSFRIVFKKITGLSPIDYRKKYNKEAGSIKIM